MSDVSAVVLTVGERHTRRAIESVRGQTLPAAEIITIDGTFSPFHRALNEGASRVGTDFFVQVDADMILDSFCFAELRARMDPEVGIAAGHLRDPMVGRVCCVKMFRRRCFHGFQVPDSISPDTDFVEEIRKGGWRLVHALRRSDEIVGDGNTFGEHRPDYTPEYTWSKFLLAGRRLRRSGDVASLRNLLWKLGRSRHASAVYGSIALVRGIFLQADRDMLGPRFQAEGEEGFERFGALIEAGGPPGTDEDGSRPRLGPDRRAAFVEYTELGKRLASAGDAGAFLGHLRSLGRWDDPLAWVAMAGLCQGVAGGSREGDEVWTRVIDVFLPGAGGGDSS